jgi:hypothetical protein
MFLRGQQATWKLCLHLHAKRCGFAADFLHWPQRTAQNKSNDVLVLKPNLSEGRVRDIIVNLSWQNDVLDPTGALGGHFLHATEFRTTWCLVYGMSCIATSDPVKTR